MEVWRLTELIQQGTWVEIGYRVLERGERAPQVPADTAEVALELRVKGFLQAPAAMGEKALIKTIIGREVEGVLVRANPAYGHGFGEPVPELQAIGLELRHRLEGSKA